MIFVPSVPQNSASSSLLSAFFGLHVDNAAELGDEVAVSDEVMAAEVPEEPLIAFPDRFGGLQLAVPHPNTQDSPRIHRPLSAGHLFDHNERDLW